MSKGFSTLELMIVVVMLGLAFAAAMPAFQGYADRARTAKAIGDVTSLSLQIERFELRTGRFPATLNELNVPIPLDPWDQQYVYLDLNYGSVIGPARKDGALVPINYDFDLYSIGADGQTAASLRAGQSRDDIVRANNGAFVGLGEDY